MKSNKSC